MFSANQHSPHSFPIFKGCDSEDILRLEKHKNWVTFEDGEYIFHENEPSNGIYCLSRGAAKIFRRDLQQKEKILSLAKVGDVLGLRAVIDKTNFSSSAVAIVDSRCCFIPKADVYQIIERHTAININIMLSLCSQINEIEQKITLISDKNMLRRVAEVLLMLMRSYGMDRENFIKVVPNWDDLANLANITSGTLIRSLNEMQQKGWISIRNRRIKIFKSHLLEEMVL